MKKKILLSALFIFFLFSCTDDLSVSGKKTYPDNSSGIQTLINNAGSGAVILIGEGIYQWKTRVEIPDGKKLVIKGRGTDKTVIISNLQMEALRLNKSGSRVTGIKFILKNDLGSGIFARGTGWRIDHCKFENSNSFTIEGVIAGAYSTDTHPVGVIDHCEFINTRTLCSGNLILMAHSFWYDDLNLGTNNAMFVEDCTFTGNGLNAVDANYGGRYVFRYNTINDLYFEAHAVQGNNRAARSWEVYNNKINQVKRSMWAPGFLRGGTGVVFNNTITGNWSGDGFALDSRRSCTALGDGGLCDGTSPWDGNEPGQAGYPARDQIGRSKDQWLWTDENPYPPQELDPAYCWNNFLNGESTGFFRHGCEASRNHIQGNRDFYNNTVKPGYTPFTYPHPYTAE